MSRVPIPKHLIHQSKEVEKNAKLFDVFVDLISVDLDKDLRELVMSNLFENIRQKVAKEGKIRLPFGLVIKRDS